jgi:hypothetical protein
VSPSTAHSGSAWEKGQRLKRTDEARIHLRDSREMTLIERCKTKLRFLIVSGVKDKIQFALINEQCTPFIAQSKRSGKNLANTVPSLHESFPADTHHDRREGHSTKPAYIYVVLNLVGAVF